MKTYYVRYRNTQGTFLRILTAVQRRGLDMTYVHAEQVGEEYIVTLVLQMNPKQAEQICREWHAIVDVEEVSSVDDAKVTAFVDVVGFAPRAFISQAILSDAKLSHAKLRVTAAASA